MNYYLNYSGGRIDFSVPAGWKVLSSQDCAKAPVVEDPVKEVERALDNPIGTPPLEQMARPRIRGRVPTGTDAREQHPRVFPGTVRQLSVRMDGPRHRFRIERPSRWTAQGGTIESRSLEQPTDGAHVHRLAVV